MFDVNDIFRGYSIEQYSEAIVETLIQLLIRKNLISSGEAKEYFKDNFTQILDCIIERDRKEVEKEMGRI